MKSQMHSLPFLAIACRMSGGLFAFAPEQAYLLGFKDFIHVIYLKIYCLKLVYTQLL